MFKDCTTKKSAHSFYRISGICAAGTAEVRQYKQIQLVILLNNWTQNFPQIILCAPLNSLFEISQ